MTLSTVALSAALTPTVVSTWIAHYLHRKDRRKKPTVHISYDEGIHIIREFLNYAAKHSVEDLQAFTAQRVPTPHWVKIDTVTISNEYLSSSATAILNQLGPKGVARVGGKEWWQWRGPAGELKAEWIEMRADYNKRKELQPKNNRIMLYVHGGAYFFGSVDTHRYQLQRHARKLKGRVFAPQYRLSPQFPFPCGLQDCLAAYLYLLSIHEPKEIILAGDSAGGGMVLSMLVIIRDRGLPAPAGGILISPWVDLTHSFPSIVKDNPGDYIPPYGFRHKPSQAWPPPNTDEILALKKASQDETATNGGAKHAMPKEFTFAEQTAVRGYALHEARPPSAEPAYPGHQQAAEPGQDSDVTKIIADNVSVVIDGITVEIKDQIQMYATNQMLSHPLVSPILQPSLGGLPPLQILSGGGEMLRDEQFYIAHKAANPTAYPPSDVYLDEHDPNREVLNKYGPTQVQLQVWDDLCHVAPTLSFTRPAKHMFRSIAQFGAWALSRAQKSPIDIMDDGDASSISSSDNSPNASTNQLAMKAGYLPGITAVGRAGDPLPAFYKHMIRQRVDKNGHVYPLDPPSAYPVLQIPPSQIGAINPQLVKKWLAAKGEWDVKFAKEKLRVQQQRLKELAHGFQDFGDESPPPSALAARRAAPGVLPERQAKKNYGMMLWSNWASKHDAKTVHKEDHADKSGGRSISVDAGQAGCSDSPERKPQEKSTVDQEGSDPVDQTRVVTDAGQTNNTTTNGENDSTCDSTVPSTIEPSRASEQQSASGIFLGPTITLASDDDKTYPFENPSTRVLVNEDGTIPVTDPSYLGHKPRSSSNGLGFITVDVADDVSTIGDKDALTIYSLTDADVNASTVAVMDASGALSAAQGSRISALTSATDASSITRESLETKPSVKQTKVETGGPTSAPQRPEMPDREEFQTAQSHLS